MKVQLSLCLTTALLALAGTSPTLSASESAVNPTGIWKWNPTNPDGRIVEVTFTLKLQGKALTGTVTRGTGSAGTTTVTNGVVKGDEVWFQTVREGKGGKSTTTYRGKLSGDTIKGNVEIDAGGKKFSNDWEANRVKK